MSLFFVKLLPQIIELAVPSSRFFNNMDSSKSPAPTSNSSEAMLISELVSYTEDFLHDLLQAFLPIGK